MTGNGSGLDAQLGTKTESTVGTLASPVTQFFPFNSAELTYEPTYIENSGIMAGSRVKDIGQVAIDRKAASGKITIPAMYKGFGWWMKFILGSTANPVTDGTLAYKQVHTPGPLRGLSFTAQVGKPQPSDGVVKPHTYRGCKVTAWTLTIQDNAVTTLEVDVDAWDEDTVTALASASYPAGNKMFHAGQVNALTTVNNDAGTAVTYATSEMSVTGGVAVPSAVTKLTITGKATLATDRYGLGGSGVKKEQLEKDYFDLTGTFEGEYDAATWETPFVAGSTIALQCTHTSVDVIESAKPYLLDIIIPAAKVTKAPAPVSGPDIVGVSGEFSIYDPKLTNLSPIQIKLRSTDSTAW